MMVGKTFVDTNVLFRSLHEDLPLHSVAVELIKQARADEMELWVSRQVLREYLVQASRPGFMTHPIDMIQAEKQILLIKSAYRIADETEKVTKRLLTLLKRYPTAGKQVHDANIVATMLVNGISTLLTTNEKDFARFEDVITLRVLR
jgi:predicted nucleic acid-binding protein